MIRDSDGRIRIELAVVDDEPAIRLLNEEGHPFFELLADDGLEGFRLHTYSGGSIGIGAGRFSVSDRQLKAAYQEAADVLFAEIFNFLSTARPKVAW
ncbi:MAG: hypothetical protein ACOYES_08950 [Bacillota bacterium]